MSYILKYTGQFKSDLKRCYKRGWNIKQMEKVLSILEKEGTLPSEYKPHLLSGKFAECWECHIKPDWILVWKKQERELILLLLNTGTHSDIFK